MQKATLLVVNGPNLNRLGVRSPEIYGRVTLDEIVVQIERIANQHNVAVKAFQSNHEGELVDFIQENGKDALGLILNPGALAHYGLSLRDCLEDIAVPTIEVHISNVHKREAFRHVLVLSAVVEGQMVGLGVDGYTMAATFLLNKYAPVRQES